MAFTQLHLTALTLVLLTAATHSTTVIQCNEWANEAQIHISCGTNKEMIRITDTRHGITRSTTSDFCGSPTADLNAHCFERFLETEMKVALACNMKSNCSETMPFNSFEKQCKAQGFDGDKYVVVTYDCVATRWQGKEIPIVDMTLNNNPNIIQDWTATEIFYLKSTSYPTFTSLPLNLCQLTVTQNTRLQITVLDLYGKNDRSSNKECSYKLLISDRNTYHVKCAEQHFNLSGSYSYQTTNSVETVQVAFQEQHSQGLPQAKVWLEIRTYSTAAGNWPKAGISQVTCDTSLPVWTSTVKPPSTTSSTTISTTTTTTTPSTASTTMTTPSQTPPQSPTPATSTERSGGGGLITEGSGAGRTTYFTTRGPSVGKLEDNNSLMPIIAGVVCGSLVIIVLVIITIVLIVRRHYVNHKPAKELEVIDAWDNQSVISAAQQSAKAYRAELEPTTDMSGKVPISYPRNSGPSFIQQTSVDGEIYAEVAEIGGDVGGISNRGYEDDSFYTGDVDGDGYYNSIGRKNVSKGTRGVSPLYAQPQKKKGHQSTSSLQSGFEDPGWLGNGDVSSLHDGGMLMGSDQEELYGYTKTLSVH